MAGRVFQTAQRALIFGMPLDLVTMDETVAACVDLIEGGLPSHHVVLNAGKVVLASKDDRLRDSITRADIVNADGQSVVWAGRFLGHRVPERVTGIDLMHRLLIEAAMRGWAVYFLGARQEVLDAAISSLTSSYPGLVIAGAHDGYFTEAAPIVHEVRASRARLLFVAMPSPAKEYLVADNLSDFGPLLAVGVGGSLDVVAGHVARAPRWMQRSGLEWLYRLLQEPKRMWRRYLVGNSRFIWLTLRERLTRR